MAKRLFEGEKAKTLITTLRHYNITLIISTHQLQKEVPTLVRNNVRDLMLFPQSEPRGLQMVYDTWVQGNPAFENFDAFQTTIKSLEQYTFLHFNTKKREWTVQKAPVVPPFRLYLHPEDTEFEGEVVFGNEQNFNLLNDEELTKETPKKEIEKKRKLEEKENKNKRQKIEKNDSVAELVRQLEGDDNVENLNEKQQKQKAKMINILRYISDDPKNPDHQLMIRKNPLFFKREIGTLTFADLKSMFLEYRTEKTLKNLIFATESKWGGLEHGVKIAIEKTFDINAENLPIISQTFRQAKNEAVLSKLAELDPFEKPNLSDVDRLISIALPIGFTCWSLYEMKQNKEKVDLRLNEEISEAERQNYLRDLLIPQIQEPSSLFVNQAGYRCCFNWNYELYK